MRALDLRVGDSLWLTCEHLPVTISSIVPCKCGYLKISYLETPHVSEVHRETALVFLSGRRWI